MRLTTRMAMALVGVLVLAVLSSLVLLLSLRHLGDLMDEMVVQNLSSVRAAEELEVALLGQRGYALAYLVDSGNRDWLEELDRRKPGMSHWLAEARQTAITPQEREIVDQIAVAYRQFDVERDRAIGLIDSGRVEAAEQILLHEMTTTYDRAYALCKELIDANQRVTQARLTNGHRQLRRAVWFVSAYVVLVALLSIWLIRLFTTGVYRPLRQITREARAYAGPDAAPAPTAAGGIQDELRALGVYLRQMMAEMAEARSDLARSRDQLVYSEKLASVGKLAASVAHEIRNPLTALSMRLYALRDDLADDPRYQEDLRVVAEEIARLDNIVRTFLEFARPPAMRPQRHAVPALVGKTLELCGRRLADKGIGLVRQEQPDLPDVLVDGEQIRQVFINLILNAVEATAAGGQLVIAVAQVSGKDGRDMVRVRFRDSGAGIPEHVRSRIFEPFFSTRENGTGLGLAIAASIMARHGGRLELEPAAATGTTFAVWLPIQPEERR